MTRIITPTLLALASLALAHDARAQNAAAAASRPAARLSAQSAALEQSATPRGAAQQPATPSPAPRTGVLGQTSAGAVLTLAELEQRALGQNPAIAGAVAEVAAAKGRAVQAGLLPNPTVGYTGDEISGGAVNRGGEHGFFVQQTIPLGGKLARGRALYTREAEAAQGVADTERQRVLTAVRRMYRAALIAERRVAVREQLVRLANESVDIAAQLFNTGVTDKPDTLTAEIEVRRAQLALIDAQNARLRVWRELGVIVGDPSLAPRALQGSADDPLPDLNQDATLARILRDSPEIDAARRETVRADAALSRAKREAAPDLVLRAGPRYNRELLERDAKPVGWEGAFEVGVTVPLFNRNQGGIADAAAGVTRSQASARQTALAATARVAEAFEQYDSARRAADLYTREILPRAEEAFTLYRRSYEQMAAGYPQVLSAQRTLVQSQDQYLDALDRAWSAAVTLEGFALDVAR